MGLGDDNQRTVITRSTGVKVDLDPALSGIRLDGTESSIDALLDDATAKTKNIIIPQGSDQTGAIDNIVSMTKLNPQIKNVGTGPIKMIDEEPTGLGLFDYIKKTLSVDPQDYTKDVARGGARADNANAALGVNVLGQAVKSAPDVPQHAAKVVKVVGKGVQYVKNLKVGAGGIGGGTSAGANTLTPAETNLAGSSPAPSTDIAVGPSTSGLGTTETGIPSSTGPAEIGTTGGNALEDVAANASVWSKVGNVFSKIAVPLGTAITIGASYYDYRAATNAHDGYRQATSVGTLFGGTAGIVTGRVVGGLATAGFILAAGGEGAMIGSCIPVPLVGTAIGFLVGIGVGALTTWLGRKVAKKIGGEDQQDKMDAQTRQQLSTDDTQLKQMGLKPELSGQDVKKLQELQKDLQKRYTDEMSIHMDKDAPASQKKKQQDMLVAIERTSKTVEGMLNADLTKIGAKFDKTQAALNGYNPAEKEYLAALKSRDINRIKKAQAHLKEAAAAFVGVKTLSAEDITKLQYVRDDLKGRIAEEQKAFDHVKAKMPLADQKKEQATLDGMNNTAKSIDAVITTDKQLKDRLAAKDPKTGHTIQKTVEIANNKLQPLAKERITQIHVQDAAHAQNVYVKKILKEVEPLQKYETQSAALTEMIALDKKVQVAFNDPSMSKEQLATLLDDSKKKWAELRIQEAQEQKEIAGVQNALIKDKVQQEHVKKDSYSHTYVEKNIATLGGINDKIKDFQSKYTSVDDQTQKTFAAADEALKNVPPPSIFNNNNSIQQDNNTQQQDNSTGYTARRPNYESSMTAIGQAQLEAATAGLTNARNTTPEQGYDPANEKAGMERALSNIRAANLSVV